MSNVFIAAHVPQELEHRARLEAAKRRISRSELVRQAVAQFIQQAETTGPKVSGTDGRR